MKNHSTSKLLWLSKESLSLRNFEFFLATQKKRSISNENDPAAKRKRGNDIDELNESFESVSLQNDDNGQKKKPKAIWSTSRFI